MQKFLAVLTALVTIITAVLGIASYLGLESALRLHLVTGLLALVLVLIITHKLFYGPGSKK
ncbi:MAG: hypothetical protein JL56_04615 [Desulfotomaculum sp. BICA1-6]|nr:MAG: hypothetical protein VR67_08565 [Peptococcaceae bacterium BRH_c8a]KJS76799.1 MAG: hypothetical protein JL56_04615 [Desulfotomaculum sp. BICA1-6]